MKAIQEAQQQKRDIEKRIRDELVAFTERTGLLVSAINIAALETTGYADEVRTFGEYRVDVKIEV